MGQDDRRALLVWMLVPRGWEIPIPWGLRELLVDLLQPNLCVVGAPLRHLDVAWQQWLRSSDPPALNVEFAVPVLIGRRGQGADTLGDVLYQVENRSFTSPLDAYLWDSRDIAGRLIFGGGDERPPIEVTEEAWFFTDFAPLDVQLRQFVEDRIASFEDRSTAVPPIDEDVQLTLYRPRTLAADAWHTVLAFLHLAEARDPAQRDPVAEVRRQAKAVLRDRDYDATTEDARTGVPRESDITIRLELPGCEVNPSERRFRWEEDVHREEFRVRSSHALQGTRVRGQLTAFVGSLLLADIWFTVPVRSHAWASRDRYRHDSAQHYRRVFASYAHADTAIVRQVERYGRLLGDDYLRDVTRLRAGERWDEALLDLIEDADVFQLFWSTSSMRSPHVRREWEHACSLDRPYFVRPTYWEVPLPQDPAADLPPAALRELHFQRLPIDEESDRRAVTAGRGDEAMASTSAGRRPGQRGMLAAVLATAAVVVGAALLQTSMSVGPPPTFAVTGPATMVTDSSATLTGRTRRADSAEFSIRARGDSRSVDAHVGSDGSVAVPVGDLRSATTYAYRLVVTLDGETYLGEARQLTTRTRPAQFTLPCDRRPCRFDATIVPSEQEARRAGLNGRTRLPGGPVPSSGTVTVPLPPPSTRERVKTTLSIVVTDADGNTTTTEREVVLGR